MYVQIVHCQTSASIHFVLAVCSFFLIVVFCLPGTGTGSASSGAAAAPGAGLTGAGLMNSPGMQSLFQQMTENPQMMQNMMSAPYTQVLYCNCLCLKIIIFPLIGERSLCREDGKGLQTQNIPMVGLGNQFLF